MSGKLIREQVLPSRTWQGMVLVAAWPGFVTGQADVRHLPGGHGVTAGATGKNRKTGSMASITTIGRFLRRPTVFGVLSGIVLFVFLVGIRETGVLQPVPGELLIIT